MQCGFSAAAIWIGPSPQAAIPCFPGSFSATLACLGQKWRATAKMRGRRLRESPQALQRRSSAMRSNRQAVCSSHRLR